MLFLLLEDCALVHTSNAECHLVLHSKFICLGFRRSEVLVSRAGFERELWHYLFDVNVLIHSRHPHFFHMLFLVRVLGEQ
jgi:hypothetical protein